MVVGAAGGYSIGWGYSTGWAFSICRGCCCPIIGWVVGAAGGVYDEGEGDFQGRAAEVNSFGAVFALVDGELADARVQVTGSICWLVALRAWVRCWHMQNHT